MLITLLLEGKYGNACAQNAKVLLVWLFVGELLRCMAGVLC